MSRTPQPRPNVTKANCLQRWDTTTSRLVSAQCPAGMTPRFLECPFPVNHAINRKVCIWEGDITLLEVDAIIAGTNEYEPPRRTFSERVFQRNRPRAEPEQVPSVGSVKITEEPCIVANYLLYTVAPKYRPRNRAASDGELHYAYRNVLERARLLGFTSLGLGILHSARKHYPPNYGAHIGLRTLRRYLEHYPDAFNIVVLVVDTFTHGLYERILPLYFPRTPLEEEAACWKLPLTIGGQWGEPLSGQGEMRIIENPQNVFEEDYEGDAHSSRQYVGEHPFAKMEGDLDTERLLGNRQITYTTGDPVLDIIMKDFEKRGRYERMLRQARNLDLTEIAQLGCIYQSGTDRLGRPVVVFIGRWFRASETNHNKFFLYLISLMDGIVNNEYVIIYFHTKTSHENRPPVNWFTAMYNVLPYKYKKNLKAIYVVHPSFWTKSLTWWFAKFLAPSVQKKIHSISGIEYLYNVMDPDDLEIPAFITEYDMSINGVHYYKPKHIESREADLEAIAAISRLRTTASEPVPSTSGLGSSSREPRPSTSGYGSAKGETRPRAPEPSSSLVDIGSPKSEVETSTWELRRSKSGYRFTKLEPRALKPQPKPSTTAQVSQSGLPPEREKEEPEPEPLISFDSLSISESQPGPSTSLAGLSISELQPGPSIVQVGLPMPKSQPGSSIAQAGLPMPKSQPGPSTAQAGLPMPKSQPGPSTAQAGLPMSKSQPGPSTAQAGLPTSKSQPGSSIAQAGLPTSKSQPGPSTSLAGLSISESQPEPLSQAGLSISESQPGPSTAQAGLPMSKSQPEPSSQAGSSAAESKKKASRPVPIPARSDPESDPWKVLLSPSSSETSLPIFESDQPLHRTKTRVKADPWGLIPSPATSEPELAAADPKAMPSSSRDAQTSSKPPSSKSSSSSTKKKGRKKRSPDSEIATTIL